MKQVYVVCYAYDVVTFVPELVEQVVGVYLLCGIEVVVWFVD